MTYSLLAANLVSNLVVKVSPKRPLQSSTKYITWPPNTRESILDFTASFGEINPDMPYLCRRGQSGPEKTVFAFSPSVRREEMKKIVKFSIFAKKQVNF